MSEDRDEEINIPWTKERVLAMKTEQQIPVQTEILFALNSRTKKIAGVLYGNNGEGLVTGLKLLKASVALLWTIVILLLTAVVGFSFVNYSEMRKIVKNTNASGGVK